MDVARTVGDAYGVFVPLWWEASPLFGDTPVMHLLGDVFLAEQEGAVLSVFVRTSEQADRIRSEARAQIPKLAHLILVEPRPKRLETCEVYKRGPVVGRVGHHAAWCDVSVYYKNNI